jgi:hypothetical protein
LGWRYDYGQQWQEGWRRDWGWGGRW